MHAEQTPLHVHTVAGGHLYCLKSVTSVALDIGYGKEKINHTHTMKKLDR